VPNKNVLEKPEEKIIIQDIEIVCRIDNQYVDGLLAEQANLDREPIGSAWVASTHVQHGLVARDSAWDRARGHDLKADPGPGGVTITPSEEHPALITHGVPFDLALVV